MKRLFKISFGIGIFTALALVAGILKSVSRDYDKDINWQDGSAARN